MGSWGSIVKSLQKEEGGRHGQVLSKEATGPMMFPKPSPTPTPTPTLTLSYCMEEWLCRAGIEAETGKGLLLRVGGQSPP